MNIDFEKWKALRTDNTPSIIIDLNSEPTDQEVVDQIRAVPEHKSANLLTDLGFTCDQYQSLPIPSQLSPSGQLCGLSGVQIGQSFNLNNDNSFCNLQVAGVAVVVSGPLVLQVQCSDSDVSGTYTDPTSGLAQMPTPFTSGGIITLNSGGTGGTFGAFVSGAAMLSGFVEAAAFQRTGTFTRVNFLSGLYVGVLVANLISAQRTVGSGGGYSVSPTSGVVNV